MTDSYLKLMVSRLAKENPKYLFPALVVLGEKPRRDGDPLLLSLGMILEEMGWQKAVDEDEPIWMGLDLRKGSK